MSGSIAALSAFNESGTQGTAVVENTDKEQGDVLSVIYNKNDTTRQLITGTSLVDVAELGAPHPEGLNNVMATYVVNTDVDVVGELYLTLDIQKQFNVPAINEATDTAFDAIPGTLGQEDAQAFSTDYAVGPFIKRIELCVGTQVFQKITPADINAWSQLNGVDQGQLIALTTAKISGVTRQVTTNPTEFLERRNDVHTASWRIGFHIPTIMDTVLPNFSNFTDQKNNGYIMAAAPHQEINIKIYFGDGVVNKTDNLIRRLYEETNARLEPTTLTIRSASLTMKHTTLSNDERLLIRDNPFSKRVSFLQTVESNSYDIKMGNPNFYDFVGGKFNPILPIIPPVTIDINCDSFNTFATGLYIQRSNLAFMDSVFSRKLLNYRSANPTGTVELLLNGSSFTREIDIQTLISCSTQNVPNSSTTNSSYTQLATAYGTHGFYLPLSNNIYGSGVPMNRFDNITVRIRFDFPFEPFGYTFNWHPAFLANYLAFWEPLVTSFRYAVTCIGETSILYSGGASSITRF